MVLSPTVHEWFHPFFLPPWIEHLNSVARGVYSAAGWEVIDPLPMTRGRPDYRLEVSWWNVQSFDGMKRAGDGVVYSIANALVHKLCSGGRAEGRTRVC